MRVGAWPVAKINAGSMAGEKKRGIKHKILAFVISSKNTYLPPTFPYLEPPPEVCDPNTQAVAGRAAAVRLARAAWRPQSQRLCVSTV